jgi:hypothetical protein
MAILSILQNPNGSDVELCGANLDGHVPGRTEAAAAQGFYKMVFLKVKTRIRFRHWTRDKPL